MERPLTGPDRCDVAVTHAVSNLALPFAGGASCWMARFGEGRRLATAMQSPPITSRKRTQAQGATQEYGIGEKRPNW